MKDQARPKQILTRENKTMYRQKPHPSHGISGSELKITAHPIGHSQGFLSWVSRDVHVLMRLKKKRLKAYS
jgi:hypothetical protein